MGYVGLPLGARRNLAGFPVMGFDGDPQRSRGWTTALAPGYIPSTDIPRRAPPAFGRRATSQVLSPRSPSSSPSRRRSPACVQPDMIYAIDSAEDVAELARRESRGARVHHLAGHHPRGRAPHPRTRRQACGLDSTWPSLRNVSTRGTGLAAGNTPKVVAGLTPSCLQRATDFYSQFVDTVVQASGLREAEMAKLLENTFRHVNIALVNEMARFSHDLDIDLWTSFGAPPPSRSASCPSSRARVWRSLHPHRPQLPLLPCSI